MTKFIMAVALSIAALPLAAGSASAHGCHRDVRRDDLGWHRHAPDCDRIQTHRDGSPLDDERAERRYRYEERERYEYRDRYYRPYRYDEPRCVQRCTYIGPIRQCEEVCR